MIYWNKVYIHFPKSTVVGRGWWVTYNQAFSSKLCVFLRLAYYKSVLLVHVHLKFIVRLLRIQVCRYYWVCVRRAFLRFFYTSSKKWSWDVKVIPV